MLHNHKLEKVTENGHGVSGTIDFYQYKFNAVNSSTTQLVLLTGLQIMVCIISLRVIIIGKIRNRSN